MTTFVKIVNVSNRENPEGYGSWLDYWRDVTKSTRRTCCIASCKGGIIGCPVVQVVGGGRDWYIIPVCQEHLNCQGQMPLESSARLVSARRDAVGRGGRGPQSQQQGGNGGGSSGGGDGGDCVIA